VSSKGAPLVVAPKGGGSEALIGVYPALVAAKIAAKRHFLSGGIGPKVVLLPDYLVEQDLPSAYQEFLRQQKVK